MGTSNSKASKTTTPPDDDEESILTLNASHIPTLNTFITDTIKACLAFTAQQGELDDITIAQNKSLRYRKNCLVPNWRFFPAKHLPLAEAARNALLAIRDNQSISNEDMLKLNPSKESKNEFAFSADDIDSKINAVSTVLTCYRTQLSAEESIRYLEKLNERFFLTMCAPTSKKGHLTNVKQQRAVLQKYFKLHLIGHITDYINDKSKKNPSSVAALMPI